MVILNVSGPFTAFINEYLKAKQIAINRHCHNIAKDSKVLVKDKCNNCGAPNENIRINCEYCNSNMQLILVIKT